MTGTDVGMFRRMDEESARALPVAARLERDVIDGWVRQVADVAKLADYISQTDFVPESMRGQPAAVAAAILTGREIGLGPMAALQHVHVIKGRPALSAQVMRALVLAAGHTLRIQESTMARCVLVGARRGGPEQSVTWTMDDARRANLGGRAMWSQYPRQMLLARATAEMCRAIFPDVLGGMAYAHEEADDLDTPPAPPPVEPPKSTVRRTRAPRAAKTPAAGAVQAPPTPPGPDVPEGAPTPPRDPGQRDPDAAAPSDTTSPAPANGEETGAGEQNTWPPDAPGSSLLTPSQRAHLMALLTEWGRDKPRSLKLRTVSGLVGRELLSTAQLSRAEASNVIDALIQLKTQPKPDEALSILVTAGWEHIGMGQDRLPLEVDE